MERYILIYLKKGKTFLIIRPHPALIENIKNEDEEVFQELLGLTIELIRWIMFILILILIIDILLPYQTL